MRLLCCVVTHNRLEYTRRTVKSWFDTADTDDDLVLFDNASTDGTIEWARGHDFTVISSDRNLFPGAATNRGWHHGLKETDARLLQRSDNDVEYLPGWREEVERAFEAHPQLGQLGVLNMHEDFDDQQPVTPVTENGHTINVHWPTVGGNCVIRRELWDTGFRWAPGAWQPGGNDEDTQASKQIHGMGWGVARVVPTVANNMSFHRYRDFPDYYNQTAGLRGLVPELSV